MPTRFSINNDGTTNLSLDHSTIAELRELFSYLNEINVVEQALQMELFFQMVEQFTITNPDKAVSAIKLSGMFAGLISTIGRLNEVIDKQCALLEEIVSTPEVIDIPFDDNRSANLIENSLVDTVGDFLDKGDAESITKVITDLVNNFFMSLDPDEKDTVGNPQLSYKCYKPSFVQDVIYSTGLLTSFLNKLSKEYDNIKHKHAA